MKRGWVIIFPVLILNCVVLTNTNRKPESIDEKTRESGPAIKYSTINWEVAGRSKIKSYLLKNLNNLDYFKEFGLLPPDTVDARKNYFLQIVYEDSYHRKIMDSDAFEENPTRFLATELNDTLFVATFFFFPTRYYIDESISFHVFYKNKLQKTYKYDIRARGYFSWLSPLLLPFSDRYRMLNGSEFHQNEMKLVARNFISDLSKDGVFRDEK